MKYDINDIDDQGYQIEIDMECCSRISHLLEMLGESLPQYKSFVLKYGASEIAYIIRLYAPNDILDQYEDFRERWEGHFHWGDSKSALTEDELLECFPIADTHNGDEFIFKTGNKSGIYCLPQDDDRIYYVGKDLQDVINFTMLSGNLFDLNKYYDGCPPEYLFLSYND